MFNLFDIMRGAQGGAAIDSMARQFGLTPNQVERAMQALLPPSHLACREAPASRTRSRARSG